MTSAGASIAPDSQPRLDPAHLNLLRRCAGEFPAAGAFGLVAGQDAECGQAVQDLLDVGPIGALEGAGHLLDGPFGLGLGHDVADGGDLFGQLLGPGRGGGRLCGGGFLGFVGGGEPFLGCGFCAAGVLEFRAQPADQGWRSA